MKEFFELKVWHYIKDKSLHIIYKAKNLLGVHISLWVF